MKFVSAIVAAVALTFASGEPLAPPSVVKTYDVGSYTGKWYQIADYPQVYESFCKECTTADYTLNSDGTIQVVNSCRKAVASKPTDVNAVATIPDSTEPAKLEVKFFHLFKAPYWIIALGEKNAANQYSWALVSNGARESCYILSRTPTMKPTDLDLVFERMAENQISNSTDKLRFTPQAGCWGNATEVSQEKPMLGGPLHASCKMTVDFPSSSCNDVLNGISIAAKNMSGTDCGTDGSPNSFCRYSETSASASEWKGKHQTRTGKYTDDLTFTLSTSGSGCSAAAYSTSETWYAVHDNGVNYCNLHNLVDRSGLKYTETANDSSCTQYSSHNCARY